MTSNVSDGSTNSEDERSSVGKISSDENSKLEMLGSILDENIGKGDGVGFEITKEEEKKSSSEDVTSNVSVNCEDERSSVDKISSDDNRNSKLEMLGSILDENI